jgi:hypothetical protein
MRCLLWWKYVREVAAQRLLGRELLGLGAAAEPDGTVRKSVFLDLLG